VLGDWTNDNTPTVSFYLSDADASDTLQFRIQISTSSSFSSVVVDYTSVFFPQGTSTFTVGQAAATGTYATGSAGQTLADRAAGYYWRVLASDGSSTSSYTTANGGAVAFKVDATAPTPGSLSITVGSTSTVTTTISGATDTVSGFIALPYVYTNASSGTSTASTAATSVLWSSLAINTSYTFYASVTDVATNTATTATVSAFTLANPPVSLTASSVSSSSINTAWLANSNPSYTEYRVFNITSNTNSGWIASTSYAFTGLTCGNSYTFEVAARNGDGILTSSSSQVTVVASGCDTNVPTVLSPTHSKSQPKTNHRSSPCLA
jgi:hypothetical protein